MTVTLRDAQSNPVTGKTVTLAKSGGSSTVTTVSGVTNGSGVATFTVKDAVAETTVYTAIDAIDSVTVTQTASVIFTAGGVSAAQSTLSASPASVTADGVTSLHPHRHAPRCPGQPGCGQDGRRSPSPAARRRSRP